MYKTKILKQITRFIRRPLLLVGGLSLVVALVVFLIVRSNDTTQLSQQTSNSEGSAMPETESKTQEMSYEEEESSEEDKKQTQVSAEEDSLTDGVVDLLVIVNKRNPIEPARYVPPELVSPDVTKRSGAIVDARIKESLESMFKAASSAGYSLMLSNGYRSYATQSSLYNSYVNQDGQVAADTYSARPGYSEHQTGLAVDIILPSGECRLEVCFGDLEEGKWIAENAHKFGFIVRYTEDNAQEAGYSYEPWHLRYIGEQNAEDYVSKNASSLEYYLGKEAAPDYL